MSASTSDPRGEVKIELAGVFHVARATFGAVLEIERELSPVGSLARRLSSGIVSMTDVARVFFECIKAAASDARGRYDGPSFDSVGQAVLERGLTTCLSEYDHLLTYMLRGGEIDEGKAAAPAPEAVTTGASPAGASSASQ